MKQSKLLLHCILFFAIALLAGSGCSRNNYQRQMDQQVNADGTVATPLSRKETRKLRKKEKQKAKEQEKQYKERLKRHQDMQSASARASMKKYKKRAKSINSGLQKRRSFWDWLFGRNKPRYQKPQKKIRGKDEWSG